MASAADPGRAREGPSEGGVHSQAQQAAPAGGITERTSCLPAGVQNPKGPRDPWLQGPGEEIPASR